MTQATLANARNGARLPSAVVWLAALPIVGTLAFVVGLAIGVRGDDIWILGLAIVTTLVALVPLILDQARPASQRHLLLTLFSLAYLVYFVLPVFTRYFLGGGYQGGIGMRLSTVLPSDIARGQVAVLVALLVLLSAYALPFGRLGASVLPAPRYDWSPGATLVVACAMIPMGWAIYLGSIFGVIPPGLGSGFLGAISKSTIFGIALLTIAYLRFRSRRALWLMGLLIPITMGFNFFTGSKGLFFWPVVIVGLTHLLVNRRIRIRWILLGIVAVALFFPVAQFYRDVVLEGFRRPVADVLRNPVAALAEVSEFASTYRFGEYFGEGLLRTGARFDGLGPVSVIIRDTPDRVPFQRGWTLGLIPLAYIPRVLWPGKPIMGIGQWITDNYGAGPGIISSSGPTWIGELYLNFGYLGIIVGFSMIGILQRFAHESLLQRSTTVPALLAGVIVLYSSAMTIGGQLTGPVNGVGMTLPLLFATHLLVRTLFRSSSPLPEPGRSENRTADARIGVESGPRDPRAEA